MLCELGWVLCDTADYAPARDYLKPALRLDSQGGDIGAMVRAERYLATIDLRKKNYAAARADFERLLARIPYLCMSADEEHTRA